MRRRLIIFLSFIYSLTLYSQNNFVENILSQYEGKQGFTTIIITSKMFSVVASYDIEDEKINNLLNSISVVVNLLLKLVNPTQFGPIILTLEVLVMFSISLWI